jgi:hypothetical protein
MHLMPSHFMDLDCGRWGVQMHAVHFEFSTTPLPKPLFGRSCSGHIHDAETVNAKQDCAGVSNKTLSRLCVAELQLCNEIDDK